MIELGASQAMLPEVHQNIDERVAYCPRCGECARVIAGFPDTPSAAEDSVHGPCEPDGETADASRESLRVSGFRDQVDVVALHGVLDHTELRARALRERAADGGEDMASAERTDGVLCPERHMHGVRGVVPWP